MTGKSIVENETIRELIMSKTVKSHFLAGDKLAAWLGALDIPGYRRPAFQHLMDYLLGGPSQYICELYGLPGTGKRTLMYQAMRELPPDKTLFVKVSAGEQEEDLVRQIGKYVENGIQYVFIVNRNAHDNGWEIMFELDGLLARKKACVVTTDQSTVAMHLSSHLQFDDHMTTEVSPHVFKICTDVDFSQFVAMGGQDNPYDYVLYGGVCPIRGQSTLARPPLARRHFHRSIALNLLRGEEVSYNPYKGDSFELWPDATYEDRLKKILGISKTYIEDILDSIESMLPIPPRAFMGYQYERNAWHCPNGGNPLYGWYVDDFLSRTDTFHYITTHYGWDSCCMKWFSTNMCLFVQNALNWYLANTITNAKALLDNFRKFLLDCEIIRGFKGQGRMQRLVFRFNKTALVVPEESKGSCTLYEAVYSPRQSWWEVLGDKNLCHAIERKFGKITEKIFIHDGPDTMYGYGAARALDIRNFIGGSNEVRTSKFGYGYVDFDDDDTDESC